MSYIRLLCLFAYGGVQHLFCFVFALFFLVLYVTVSLDCPFFDCASKIYPGKLLPPKLLLQE
jgi:hypothetical protein